MATSGLETLFETNINSLAKALDKSVRVAQIEYEQLQQSGLKSELTDIYVSFLRSSVLCKHPWLRIDLYDSVGRTDHTECCADFDVRIISESIYAKAEQIKEENRWRNDLQIKQAWLNASDKCYQMFEKYLPQIIDESETAQLISCRWHFGQFLGETVVVKGRSESVK